MNTKTIKLSRFLLLTFLLTSSKSQESAYTLPVDPIADLFSYMNQPFVEDGKSKLATFSYNENALLIYDLEEQEIEKKIKYDNQGPNRLTNMKIYGGLEYVNSDTIAYYDDQGGIAYLSDAAGYVYKRQIVDGGNVGFGSMSIEKSMAYKNGHLYIQAWPITIGTNEMKDPENYPNHIGKINLKNGSVEKLRFDFPTVYQGKDYSMALKTLNIIYNQSTDKFVINFPLSDSIYVTDFQGYKKAYIAKSNLVKKALNKEDNKGTVSPNTIDNYTNWLSDAYEKLMFDPVSGYYFRVARKGLTERAYEARNFATEKEVLVFDQDFNHVKTLKHHGGSFLYYFFKDDKIYWNKYFKKYNLEAGNEDVLYFDQIAFR